MTQNIYTQLVLLKNLLEILSQVAFSSSKVMNSFHFRGSM